MSEKKETSELVNNRRAYHDYEILDSFEAGIALQGTEIKSLRDHGGSLQESYVRIIQNEAWLIGSNIAPYRFGNIHNHPEKRDRKLLLHKREIQKLKSSTAEKGLTLIALSMYLKNGKIKVKVGVAKGKKLHDKREALKEKDEKRSIQKALKQMY